MHRHTRLRRRAGARARDHPRVYFWEEGGGSRLPFEGGFARCGKGKGARAAARLYARLRANLLRAVIGEWAKTGALYEQYDDRTGRGMRSHPFTGWTALILNIAAEEYD